MKCFPENTIFHQCSHVVRHRKKTMLHYFTIFYFVFLVLLASHTASDIDTALDTATHNILKEMVYV